MTEYKISNPAPGLWVIWDDGINLYLIAGTERAVLLDSGFGFFPNLRKQAEALCGLPVELVHTHAHGDHTGGDGEWAQAWLHPSEWAEYRRSLGGGMKLLPLEDGMVLDLGGRSLEAVHVPGHTPGSAALLDRENRLLFSGDTVMTQPVFLFSPGCTPEDYRASLEKLKRQSGAFDLVYPSHQRWPLEPFPALDALLDCARQAEAGDANSLVTFELDLKVAVARFAGYRKDGFSVAVKELDAPKN